MNSIEAKRTQPKYAGFLYLALLCVICVLLNFAGARLAALFGLPLFLDNVGTILSGAMGGFIPGIIVGFLSNMVNGIMDPDSFYYGVLSILIALLAAFFHHQGYFRKIPQICIPILAFTAIGGGLGSLITWGLYGLDFGTGNSAALAHMLYDNGIFSQFWSQFMADLVYDLLDKTVVVIIAAILLRILPQRLPRMSKYQIWEQNTFTEKEKVSIKDALTLKKSLNLEFMAIISAGLIIIAITVSIISYRQFHSTNVQSQINMGYGVANVVKDSVNPNRIDEFLEHGSRADGYVETENRLASIANSTEEIEYVYIYRIEPDGCHVVFDPDTPTEKGSAPGTLIPFDDAFRPYTQKLLNGEPIDPIISNESYGWLLSIYVPMYDKDGVCQAYAGVDISMTQLKRSEYVFLTRIICLFLGFFVVILAVITYLVRRNMIQPLNAMAIAADAFAYNSETARADSMERLRELNISTGNEIENLYNAFVKTSEDTVQYIAEAQKRNAQITKLQNGLILVLADLVESRDKCTGNHVRNTANYARMIMEQMQKDGIYSEYITDDYIFEVVSAAPLHDVGKIQVPDAILNKPGKLTDEEFSKMKDHASAGAEILSQAIGTMADAESGYLREAMNVANYHHERWDGKGYPKGLAGEYIPLSARIMAVADVFDALVAKRSYKEGFPVDKALAIIKEGIGTQFDPKVVEAFLHTEDKVRAWAETQNEIAEV